MYVFHRHPSGGSEELLALHPNVQRVEKQVGFKRAKRDGRNLQKRVLLEHEPTKRELAEAKPADKAIKFNDPLFKYEWYLVSNRDRNASTASLILIVSRRTTSANSMDRRRRESFAT